jgi:hypothetical protein
MLDLGTKAPNFELFDVVSQTSNHLLNFKGRMVL